MTLCCRLRAHSRALLEEMNVNIAHRYNLITAHAQMHEKCRAYFYDASGTTATFDRLDLKVDDFCFIKKILFCVCLLSILKFEIAFCYTQNVFRTRAERFSFSALVSSLHGSYL